MKNVLIIVNNGLIEDVLSDEDIAVTIVDFYDKTEEETKELIDFVEQKKKQLKSVY